MRVRRSKNILTWDLMMKDIKQHEMSPDEWDEVNDFRLMPEASFGGM